MKVCIMMPSLMKSQAINLAEQLMGKPSLKVDLIIGLKYKREVVNISIAAGLITKWLGTENQLSKKIITKTFGDHSERNPVSTWSFAESNRLRHEFFKSANNKNLSNLLREMKIDIVVSYGAGILRKKLLNSGPIFINAHAGKLPKYGGMNVVEWAFYNNEQDIYGTIHRIDVGIDTGDILLEKKLAIRDCDNLADAKQKAGQLVWDMVPDALELFANKKIDFKQQPEGTRVQWFRMHSKLLEVAEKNFLSEP